MIGLSPCGRDVWRTAVRLTVINSSYNTRELHGLPGVDFPKPDERPL
jgi:hypothetical protein